MTMNFSKQNSPLFRKLGSFLSYNSIIASRPCRAATRNADRMIESLPFLSADISN